MSIEKLVKKIAGLHPAIAGLITVTTGLAMYLNAAGKEAGRFAEINAKQEAILRATSSAAGLTASQLDEMARALSKTTELQVSAVKEGQSMMLTFRNIGEETFPRAMQAAADLQTTFGSLNESVKQVSMAANDFDGYTRLQRSGVTFSEEQKKQIKQFKEANDLIAYQDLLLTEIERQVGGTAAAIAAAGDGTGRLNASLEVLSAEVGRGILPLQQAWNNALADSVDRLAELVETERDYYDLKKQATAAARENKKEVEDGAVSFGRLGKSVRVSGEEIRYHTAMIERQNSHMALNESQLKALGVQFMETNKAITENAEATEAASKANLDFLKLTETFANDYSKAQEQAADFAQRRGDIEAEINEKIQMGYLEQSDVIQGLRSKLEELTATEQRGAEEAELAGKRRKLSMLEQQMAVDGLETAEMEYLLKLGNQWGIYSDDAVKAAQDTIREVDMLKLKFDNLPEYKRMTIEIFQKGGASLSELQYAEKYINAEHRAAGGPVGAGQPYVVGERGPEMFVPNQSGQIVPNGAMGGQPIDYDRMGDAVAQAMARSGLIQ